MWALHDVLHDAEPGSPPEGKSSQHTPFAQSASSSHSIVCPGHVEPGGLQDCVMPRLVHMTQQKLPWLTSQGAPLHGTDPGLGEPPVPGGVVGPPPLLVGMAASGGCLVFTSLVPFVAESPTLF
jgi:hypothetical protein